jgi:hypothetical protein
MTCSTEPQVGLEPASLRGKLTTWLAHGLRHIASPYNTYCIACSLYSSQTIKVKVLRGGFSQGSGMSCDCEVTNLILIILITEQRARRLRAELTLKDKQANT